MCLLIGGLVRMGEAGCVVIIRKDAKTFWFLIIFVVVALGDIGVGWTHSDFSKHI